MRCAVLTVCILVAFQSALAEEPAGPATDPDAAIERGLAFLAKDAVAWKKTAHCASCHHVGIIVWAMNEAKLRGVPVDESVRSDLTQWAAKSGDDTGDAKKPENAPHALNIKALYFALALGTDPNLDATAAAGLKHLRELVEADQTDEGCWQTWPESRPPIKGPSDEKMTLLAALALLPAAAQGDERAQAAQEKAVAWLDATASDDDPQSTALRLVLWRRLNRPAGQREALVQKIRERQNPDGGWSQTPEMASDAWATGQALYALSAGEIKADDPAIQRGRAFLATTQRKNGSWPMTSRPEKPGGRGAKFLIPITGAGSAWGVIGLLSSR